jgi:hypothetical protein
MDEFIRDRPELVICDSMAMWETIVARTPHSQHLLHHYLGDGWFARRREAGPMARFL